MRIKKYDLEIIKAWFEEDKLDQSQMGPMGVVLLQALTRANEPENWDPAIDVTHDLLNVIDQELNHNLEKWTSGESAKLFSFLLTILVEAGQYRHETFDADPENLKKGRRRKLVYENLLPKMGELRERTIETAKKYLMQDTFSSLRSDILAEIFPLLESMGDTSGKNYDRARDRYMPFRVTQAGNVVERLYSFHLRTVEPSLIGDIHSTGLLREIYDRKYARFGTSGVRGRWEMDFTKVRAKRVLQAICDFLKADDLPEHIKAKNLQGKRVVIGYDSRRNARLVAEWAAQVCLANGFTVDLANRDTPTPALVYYLTDYLAPDEVAGLINCTASHNPPEWQGIKFNPRQGYPAPTKLTDFIAARANQLQLLDTSIPAADLAEAEARGDLRGFDPITNYTDWILYRGKDDRRISIDPERIRKHFASKMVVVDEMHGASRGYLSRLLGEIGVRHTVIHAERDPNLPGLAYANPEEPFINALEVKVSELNDVALGVGLDTDADRFGVVDWDGTYYRPNQVLPMLIRYLGIDRELPGRIIATQTGSPLIEELARQRAEKLAAEGRPNEQDHPAWEKGVLPAFVDHPFYQLRVGERKDQMYKYTFMVPVGIKYIEEQRRTDRSYNFLEELPEGWRNTILIGGEESSGLTTRGHVTDKDGVWANLLIMDMIAHYEKSVRQIWEDTVKVAGWKSFGGLEWAGSNTGRTDVDAVLEVKENLISQALDRFKGKAVGQATLRDWLDHPADEGSAAILENWLTHLDKKAVDEATLRDWLEYLRDDSPGEAMLKDYLAKASPTETLSLATLGSWLDRSAESLLGALRVVLAGGIRYDFVEIQLQDTQGKDKHYLRVRASGTEPINRIYVESSDRVIAVMLMLTALRKLEELSRAEIESEDHTRSEWRLVEILSSTQPSPPLIESAKLKIDKAGWDIQSVILKLKRILPAVEHRNQRITEKWIEALSDEG